MFTLQRSLQAWGSAAFATTLKAELESVDKAFLPLQQGLSHTSYVADSDINVVILSAGEHHNQLWVKAGVFYAGIIAGSCCADDPTPVDELPEYCELSINIDRGSGEASVILYETD